MNPKLVTQIIKDDRAQLEAQGRAAYAAGNGLYDFGSNNPATTKAYQRGWLLQQHEDLQALASNMSKLYFAAKSAFLRAVKSKDDARISETGKHYIQLGEELENLIRLIKECVLAMQA